jgi:hypothetical protein
MFTGMKHIVTPHKLVSQLSKWWDIQLEHLTPLIAPLRPMPSTANMSAWLSFWMITLLMTDTPYPDFHRPRQSPVNVLKVRLHIAYNTPAGMEQY